MRERFILRVGLRLGVGAALSEVACARVVWEGIKKTAWDS